MKKFIIILLLFTQNFAYSFDAAVIPYSQTQSNSNNAPFDYNVISQEEYDSLEKKIFKKTFSNESSSSRLSRLEKEVFGMEQKGEEEERFENLITASDYYLSGYRQAQSVAEAKANAKNRQYNSSSYNDDYIPSKEYYIENKNDYTSSKSNKKQSKFKQLLSDISDALFSGVVTVYTLPMYNYDIDNFDTYNIIDQYNYSSLPQFPVYTPQVRNYISPYSYNRQYNPYISRQNYYNPPPIPLHNQRGYYSSPYGYMPRQHQSGARVNIIH